MQMPCEVGVKTVVPAIRALLAKKLVEQHGMNESQTAVILGLSQSAISRYKTKNRGHILSIDNDQDVQLLLDKMIQLLLYEKPLETIKILDIFCKTCSLVREKGILCSFCQKRIPSNKSETCTFCFSKKVC
jgi:predicted transcriptional regulator